MAMTLEQRRNLAMAVLSEVGNLAEFWDEKAEGDSRLDGIDREEALQTIANWMAPLPTGNRWTSLLPQPTVKC